MAASSEMENIHPPTIFMEERTEREIKCSNCDRYAYSGDFIQFLFEAFAVPLKSPETKEWYDRACRFIDTLEEKRKCYSYDCFSIQQARDEVEKYMWKINETKGWQESNDDLKKDFFKNLYESFFAPADEEISSICKRHEVRDTTSLPVYVQWLCTVARKRCHTFCVCSPEYLRRSNNWEYVKKYSKWALDEGNEILDFLLNEVFKPCPEIWQNQIDKFKKFFHGVKDKCEFLKGDFFHPQVIRLIRDEFENYIGYITLRNLNLAGLLNHLKFVHQLLFLVLLALEQGKSLSFVCDMLFSDGIKSLYELRDKQIF